MPRSEAAKPQPHPARVQRYSVALGDHLGGAHTRRPDGLEPEIGGTRVAEALWLRWHILEPLRPRR